MFINMQNLGEVTEPKPVPNGRYDVTISEAKYVEEKNYIRVSLGIQGHLDAPNVNHFISLPKKDDDAGKATFKQLMLKRFLVQFRIPFDNASGFNVDDFAGATANAQLNLGEPNADTGAVYNELVVDKLPNEAEKPAGGSRKR